MTTMLVRVGAGLIVIVVAVVTLSACAGLKEAYRVDPLLADRARPGCEWSKANPVCFTTDVLPKVWRAIAGTRPEDPIVLEGKNGLYCWNDYRAARGPAFVPDPDCSQTTTLSTTSSTTTTSTTTTSTTAVRRLSALDTTTTNGGNTTTTVTIPMCSSPECRARNAIIEKLLRKSDEICKNHISGFLGQDAANRLFLGAAGQGLSLAATTAGGPLGMALSASSSGVQGFNTLLKQVVYTDVFAPIIAVQVRKQQIVYLQNIQQNARQPVDEYPVDRAIREVQQYHTMCSFYRGIAGIAEEVANQPIAASTTTTVTTTTSTTMKTT